MKTIKETEKCVFYDELREIYCPSLRLSMYEAGLEEMKNNMVTGDTVNDYICWVMERQLLQDPQKRYHNLLNSYSATPNLLPNELRLTYTVPFIIFPELGDEQPDEVDYASSWFGDATNRLNQEKRIKVLSNMIKNVKSKLFQ
jgi:hypothetical protein